MKKYMLFFLVLLSTTSWAQYSMIATLSSAQVEEYKKMKVVVQLEAVDEPTINGDDKVRAEKMCGEYNAFLKELIPSFWKFSDSKPEFMYQKEIENIKNKEEYLVLYATTISDGNGGITYDKEINWRKILKKYKSFSSTGTFKTKERVCLNLDRLKKKRIASFDPMEIWPLFTEPLFDFVDRTELMDHIHLINAHGNGIKELLDTKSLSQKTLLIRQDLLEKSLTEGDISKVYSYPFKIVSKEQLTQMLQEDKKSEFAYISWYPTNIVRANVSGNFLVTKQSTEAASGKEKENYLLDAKFFSDLLKN